MKSPVIGWPSTVMPGLRPPADVHAVGDAAEGADVADVLPARGELGTQGEAGDFPAEAEHAVPRS